MSVLLGMYNSAKLCGEPPNMLLTMTRWYGTLPPWMGGGTRYKNEKNVNRNKRRCAFTHTTEWAILSKTM